MNIRLDMSESDIVRAMRDNKYSPLEFLAARHFKEDVRNVEVNHDNITLWNDDINDYKSFRFCNDDIKIIKSFIDEWEDYIDGYLVDFAIDPISFCVEQNR